MWALGEERVRITAHGHERVVVGVPQAEKTADALAEQLASGGRGGLGRSALASVGALPTRLRAKRARCRNVARFWRFVTRSGGWSREVHCLVAASSRTCCRRRIGFLRTGDLSPPGAPRGPAAEERTEPRWQG